MGPMNAHKTQEKKTKQEKSVNAYGAFMIIIIQYLNVRCCAFVLGIIQYCNNKLRYDIKLQIEFIDIKKNSNISQKGLHSIITMTG